MKIYVAHPTGFDFKTELYLPLKESKLCEEHEFVFPDDRKDAHSKDVIASCYCVLAETSLPSTGMGIELGWAESMGIPVLCIHKKDAVPSAALRHIAREIRAYADSADIPEIVASMLE